MKRQQDPLWVGPTEAENLFGLSRHQLKKLRLNGKLTENIHWVAFSPTHTLYNVQLMNDWLLHRGNPQQHLANIKAYLDQQLSSESRRAS